MTTVSNFLCVKIWLCERVGKSRETKERWQSITSCSLEKYFDHGPAKDFSIHSKQRKWNGKQKDYTRGFPNLMSKETRLSTFSVNKRNYLNLLLVPLSVWNNTRASNTTYLDVSREITLVIYVVGKENITTEF